MSYCETARPSWRSLPTTKPIRSSEPTDSQEPVTLEEAKHQCGIASDITYHDDYLRGLITAARQKVESDASLACYAGTFVWKFTEFPAEDWFEFPAAARPVTSVTSIAYIDAAGATQTWSSSNYVLDTSGQVPFVRLAYGQSWPTIRGDISGIAVTYVAGYSSVTTIPQRVKQAVLLAINVLWLQNNNEHQQADRQREGYERFLSHQLRESYP